ncbi:PREDICTED: uncharacterized protein LOC106148620, partial [Chinchilla lanigera]|uniref:uncharacterized protein LOC106148620 n=1 Tax=Chinchilla lanigera TaxID=34839 RepID=UPI0006988CAE
MFQLYPGAPYKCKFSDHCRPAESEPVSHRPRICVHSFSRGFSCMLKFEQDCPTTLLPKEWAKAWHHQQHPGTQPLRPHSKAPRLSNSLCVRRPPGISAQANLHLLRQAPHCVAMGPIYGYREKAGSLRYLWTLWLNTWPAHAGAQGAHQSNTVSKAGPACPVEAVTRLTAPVQSAGEHSSMRDARRDIRASCPRTSAGRSACDPVLRLPSRGRSAAPRVTTRVQGWAAWRWRGTAARAEAAENNRELCEASREGPEDRAPRAAAANPAEPSPRGTRASPPARSREDSALGSAPSPVLTPP